MCIMQMHWILRLILNGFKDNNLYKTNHHVPLVVTYQYFSAQKHCKEQTLVTSTQDDRVPIRGIISQETLTKCDFHSSYPLLSADYWNWNESFGRPQSLCGF